MAAKAVARHGIAISLACRTFGVSQTCYRYSRKLNEENEQIADLLCGLTKANKTWGFGLCFLYLRNVRGHGWNHKRVYRIYRELELNLRIKPRRRLKRENPMLWPCPMRQTWSGPWTLWRTVWEMADCSGSLMSSTTSTARVWASRWTLCANDLETTRGR